MTDKLKTIADRIRDAKLAQHACDQVGQGALDTNYNDGKEEKKYRQNDNSKEKPEGQPLPGLIEKIKSLEIDESDGTYIHLRISAQMHSKLLALKLAKISAQKLGAFALIQLLDHPEIKQTIKKILNDLE